MCRGGTARPGREHLCREGDARPGREHLCREGVYVYVHVCHYNVSTITQADDFLRVYPPFVNFFEMSKEALSRCDRFYPRFHAFLKVIITNPAYNAAQECSSLQMTTCGVGQGDANMHAVVQL